MMTGNESGNVCDLVKNLTMYYWKKHGKKVCIIIQIVWMNDPLNRNCCISFHATYLDVIHYVCKYFELI